MGAETDINWADRSFNAWIGCTKVSPACDNCYAAVATPSRTLGVVWGAGKPRYRTIAANWKLPLRWNARPFYECTACGWRGDDPNGASCPRCRLLEGSLRTARQRVFSASLSDWLDNEVPATWLADLLGLIRLTPNLDWLLLTKRIGNWRTRLELALATIHDSSQRVAMSEWIQGWIAGNPPANVWIGATICNQAEADRYVPKLLALPAAVRFLSIEPMLGPINLDQWLFPFKPCADCPCPDPEAGRAGFDNCCKDPELQQSGIGWVICGGESGAHARPMHPYWVRSLRDQCAAADVPFLFKQWGEWAPALSGMWFDPMHGMPNFSSRAAGKDTHDFGNGLGAVRIGKRAAGRTLDGKTHHEFPGEKAHVG